MKKLYNLSIIALCLSTLALEASQKNAKPDEKKKPKSQNNSSSAQSTSNNGEQKATPTSTPASTQTTAANTAPNNSSSTQANPTSAPLNNTPPQQQAAPAQKDLGIVEKNTNKAEKTSHPALIHATRVLPKKTMESLQQLIQGLPTYSKNLSQQSAVKPADIQSLQASLASFTQALGQKHTYLAENKSQTAVNLDSAAILTHIKVILKSLPWYIQNPTILATHIDLKAFSKELNLMHKAVQKDLNTQLQAFQNQKSQKHNASKEKDVHTASLILERKDLSEDQQYMTEEDSDGSIANETISSEHQYSADNGVLTQSLWLKSAQHAVTNKKGNLIGYYKQTGMEQNHSVGKFISLKGKTYTVLAAETAAPKIQGVSKKIVGYMHNTGLGTKEFKLYSYTSPLKK